ncbi:MAG: sialidase family protein [Thermoanaerobaculia bacterium]
MRFLALRSLPPAALALLLLAVAPPATAQDTLVSVGSPSSPFSQNKQNEPGLAVDSNHPTILAAGANDLIDMEACNAGDPTRCPFTQGVGVSGIYFSFNSGATWTQPTYTGWTARDCLGPAECAPHVGPIGTLPWYYEEGLVADGDPSLAFGPRRGVDGRFSWANGSRLYYASLAANFSTLRSEESFKGFEAVAVSRTDDVAAAAAGDKNAWQHPVIVSKQNSALFSDKETIWADNASSSPYFGNVYICNVAFRSFGGPPEPVIFSRSTDGGDTWTNRQISQAANTVSGQGRSGGRQGCTVRTDSLGTVYVFWNGSLKGGGVQYMARSFDGGRNFEKAQPVASVVEVGVFDPVQGDVLFDGVAGSRTDSFPSVDIANGAPTGGDATNTIVMTWADARNGLNHEEALVQFSTNSGVTWSTPANGALATDRPDFPAVAISPDGKDVYLTYDNFQTPFQTTTSAPRWMQGVVRHAVFLTTPGAWSDLHRGAVGDARGSSTNSLVEEFLGDYNSIVATRTYAAAVWNDVRNAADCPAIDAYRLSLYGTPITRPAPGTDCPPTFGNSDIFGGSYIKP